MGKNGIQIGKVERSAIPYQTGPAAPPSVKIPSTMPNVEQLIIRPTTVAA
jgi:hypothetical protein